MFSRSPASNPVDPYQGIDDFAAGDTSPTLVTPATDNARLPCKIFKGHRSTAAFTTFFRLPCFTLHGFHLEFLKVSTLKMSKEGAMTSLMFKNYFYISINYLSVYKNHFQKIKCGIILRFGDKIDLWRRCLNVYELNDMFGIVATKKRTLNRYVFYKKMHSLRKPLCDVAYANRPA